jgi:hypothetical protein
MSIKNVMTHRQGPDPDQHQIVRWRLVDLRNEIARTFGVEMHERTVGKLLARQQFSRISARPRHLEQDDAAQEAQKNLQHWLPRRFRSRLWASPSNSGGKTKGSVANFLGGPATPMDMTGFIPPTKRIAEPDTLRLSSATGRSESYA